MIFLSNKSLSAWTQLSIGPTFKHRSVTQLDIIFQGRFECNSQNVSIIYGRKCNSGFISSVFAALRRVFSPFLYLTAFSKKPGLIFLPQPVYVAARFFIQQHLELGDLHSRFSASCDSASLQWWSVLRCLLLLSTFCARFQSLQASKSILLASCLFSHLKWGFSKGCASTEAATMAFLTSLSRLSKSVTRRSSTDPSWRWLSARSNTQIPKSSTSSTWRECGINSFKWLCINHMTFIVPHLDNATSQAPSSFGTIATKNSNFS